MPGIRLIDLEKDENRNESKHPSTLGEGLEGEANTGRKSTFA
ncbi:hypothetical protein ACFLT1_08855 [Bacteroidota bacterium]